MLGTPLNRPIVGFAAISSTQTSTPPPVTTPPPTTPPPSTSPLTITTSGLPNATAGDAYSTSLTATGGTTPYSWTITSGLLPTGLSMSPTGVITGTPNTSGGFLYRTGNRCDNPSRPDRFGDAHTHRGTTDRIFNKLVWLRSG